MLPAVHLLIGVTIGIFLLYLTRDCRALLYCAFGSLLPDIIDKPVGHIILTSLGNGRIFFHSLTICVFIAALGCIIYLKWRHPGLIFISAGMLSHQLADAMWAAPRSWYWPFLGPFPPKYFPYYFTDMFSLEFSSPSELLVIILAVLLLLCLFLAWRRGNNRIFRWAAAAAGVLLLAAGLIALSGLAAGFLPDFLVYSGFQDTLICSLSLLFGGIAFLLVFLAPPVGCSIKDFI